MISEKGSFASLSIIVRYSQLIAREFHGIRPAYG